MCPALARAVPASVSEEIDAGPQVTKKMVCYYRDRDRTRTSRTSRLIIVYQVVCRIYIYCFGWMT